MDTARRLKVAFASLVAVTAFGVVGYMMLGFTLLEAVYQTVTTIATVGFREVNPLTPVGEIFTIALIIVGVGVVLYNLGMLLELVTEGELRRYLERRSMDHRIAGMRGHVIVCGYGRVGRAATNHLLASGAQVVVVDTDGERMAALTVPHLVGDVTQDATLRRAGIERARALIATLDTDAETVYVTLSARALRPDLVIVSRARTTDSKDKLTLAGATRAVNPQRIGGERIAAFALQPHVAEFLDVVMHDEELDFRIQSWTVDQGSPLIGHRIHDLDLQARTGAMVLAVRSAPHLPFTASPLDVVVAEGNVLITFGSAAQVVEIGRLAHHGIPPETPRIGGTPHRPGPAL